MKKLIVLFSVIVMVTFIACLQDAKEKEEKAKQDSIAKIDSIRNAEAKSSVTINIKGAFDQGIIQLKFEGLEGGKVVEITPVNLTTNSLTLIISEGITRFTDNIAINVTQQQSLYIPANGSAKIKVNQESGGLISGSMTLQKNPPK